MEPNTTRRDFLKVSTAAVVGDSILPGSAADRSGSSSVRVVVWDEQQPAQKEAYANFLGNQIAAHLREQEGISVRSVRLDDPGQGLAGDVLENCRVLIWWGHVRQAEIAPEMGKAIVGRIKAGNLALIALHSAHWSTPFVEAMNERARIDAEKVIKSRGREGSGRGHRGRAAEAIYSPEG